MLGKEYKIKNTHQVHTYKADEVEWNWIQKPQQVHTHTKGRIENNIESTNTYIHGTYIHINVEMKENEIEFKYNKSVISCISKGWWTTKLFLRTWRWQRSYSYFINNNIEQYMKPSSSSRFFICASTSFSCLEATTPYIHYVNQSHL